MRARRSRSGLYPYAGTHAAGDPDIDTVSGSFALDRRAAQRNSRLPDGALRDTAARAAGYWAGTDGLRTDLCYNGWKQDRPVRTAAWGAAGKA